VVSAVANRCGRLVATSGETWRLPLRLSNCRALWLSKLNVEIVILLDGDIQPWRFLSFPKVTTEWKLLQVIKLGSVGRKYFVPIAKMRLASSTRFGLRFAPKSWSFELNGRKTLDVRCPWRIVKNGRVALGNADDGQKFGLPSPVDASREAMGLLGNPIARVTIHENTSDLILELESGPRFELFNFSSGYEGWECSRKNGLLLVARRGSELQIWDIDPPLT